MKQDLDLLLQECSVLVEEIGKIVPKIDKRICDRAKHIKSLAGSIARETGPGRARMTGSGKSRCPSCQRPF